MENKKWNILIVGAGPTGLMMACQLALHKIPFRIIDKKAQPTEYSGALILQAGSLEIFRQLGLDRKAIQAGTIAHHISFIFNGKKRCSINIENIGQGQSHFPYLLMLEQSKTEQILIDFITQHGYSVERETEFLRFQQNDEEIITVIKKEGNDEEIIKTDYLIAADGSHSSIRKQLKDPFKGKTYKESLFVTDCDAETMISNDEICFSIAHEAIAGYFPLPNGRWRIDGVIAGKSSFSFTDLEQLLIEKNNMPVKISNTSWFSIFHCHQRCAKVFRYGRCFLLGDAAHIHTPIGAQGMNTGIQDAANLGWKMAYVISGKAKAFILHTYSAERRPVAKKVMRFTGLIYNFIVSQSTWVLFIQMWVLPYLLDFILTLVQRRKNLRKIIFKSVSETGIHYKKSLLSFQNQRFKIFQRVRSGERLPFVIYFNNNKEENTHDEINKTSFLLIIFIKDAVPREMFTFVKKYKHILSSNFIYYNEENKKIFDQFGFKERGICLVRPDMFIAYINYSLDTKDLEKHLLKFFIHHST